MVRPLRLSRLATGLAVIPFAALLAAACGGTDVVEASDASTSADASPDGALNDARGADVAIGDTGSTDADAGHRDADAATSDADAGLDAADGGSLLGRANNFAVLAGTAITVVPLSPPTIISGDVGVAPGTAIASFTHPVGTNHAGDAVALQAQADLTAAYNTLAGMACPPANLRSGVDLGGKTLFAGVYCFSSSAQLTGALTLDAQNNPNAVWVIQVGTALTTATASTVTIINGGSACNVHWQIGSSATLGTGTSLLGNIVALDSITFVTGSNIMKGRALARNGGVSFDGSTVNSTACP